MLINLPLNLYHIIFPMVSPATTAVNFHCRTIYIFDHLSGAMRTTINCLGSVCECSSFRPSKREGVSFPTGGTHRNSAAFAACHRGILRELVIAVSRQVRKYH